MVIDKRRTELLVKVLHHLCAHFKEHAVLKGGMELALYSSIRSTNDLDFVFVPYNSKKDIVDLVYKTLLKLADGPFQIERQLNSKNAKFHISKNDVAIEVEISVAKSVESVAINTALIAKPFGIQPQIIRVMKPEVALAHKIAAWNERRLLRDVYDIYFWFGIQKIRPDLLTLKERLSKVESRIPSLKKKTKMSLGELCEQLSLFVGSLSQQDLDRELTTIAATDREGLESVIVSQIRSLIAELSKYSH